MENENDEKLFNINDIVLLNSFTIGKSRYHVFLHSGLLVWEKENSKQGKTTIPICDIINVKGEWNDIDNCENIINPKYFIINYAKCKYIQNYYDDDLDVDERCRNENINKEKLKKWRCFRICLHSNDVRTVKIWLETLKIIIKQQNHPKRLLVFVNPFGGKRKGLKIYEKYAKPIFELANIEVTLIVTQRRNQIRDMLEQTNDLLQHYDGVVCVGGDGTFAEVFNGLLNREAKCLKTETNGNRIMFDDLDKIKRPSMPIGIIPGGSTDTVAYCLHGTTDLQTSVIHIVLGQIGGLDLMSVCSNDSQEFLQFCSSVMSYGYLGDVAKDSSKYRWMGPKRYEYSGAKKFFKNNGYFGEISFLLSNNEGSAVTDINDPTTGPKCQVNCKRCLNNQEASDNMMEVFHPENETWKTIKGKFFMINSANISCACERAPQGFAPFAHLGDGYIDLIIIKHTTFINNIKLLLTLTRDPTNLSKLPFVDVFRTKKFIFRTPTLIKDSVETLDNMNPDESDKSICCCCFNPLARLCNLHRDDRSYHVNTNNSTVNSPSGIRDINNSSSSTSDREIGENIKHQRGRDYSIWNCDGEVIHELDVILRSHCQMIRVYRHAVDLYMNKKTTELINETLNNRGISNEAS